MFPRFSQAGDWPGPEVYMTDLAYLGSVVFESAEARIETKLDFDYGRRSFGQIELCGINCRGFGDAGLLHSHDGLRR